MKNIWLLAAALLAAPLLCAHAETRVWTNLVVTPSPSWSSAVCWSNGVPVDGDSLALMRHPLGFGVTAVNDLTNITIHSIQCETVGYAISGGALRLAGDVTIGGPTTGASLSFSTPMELLGPSHTFLGTNGGAITFNNNVVNAPTGSVVILNAASVSFRISAASDYRAETRFQGGFMGLNATRIKGPVLVGGGTNFAGLVLQSGNLFGDFPPVSVFTNGSLQNISTINHIGAFTLNSGTVRLGALAPNGRISVNGDALLTGGGSLVVNASNDQGTGELSVTGAVMIAGCTLTFQGGSFPFSRPGMVIRNDGADPVVGTFTGLPEGSFLTNGALRYVVSYAGGDGNDVTLSPVITAPVLMGAAVSGGLMQFTVQGQSNLTYRIETATNLLDAQPWQPIRTNIASAAGVVSFSDPDTALFPRRIYRAVRP